MSNDSLLEELDVDDMRITRHGAWRDDMMMVLATPEGNLQRNIKTMT
jgi:hypothetical protein